MAKKWLKFSKNSLPKLKTHLSNIFLNNITHFKPIGVWTRLAPKNDRRHLKDKHVGCKKMARNGGKMTKHKICVLFKFPDFTFSCKS